MLVKIEARILIFPGTDFHLPSTSVPPGTFLGSGGNRGVGYSAVMGTEITVTPRGWGPTSR